MLQPSRPALELHRGRRHEAAPALHQLECVEWRQTPSHDHAQRENRGTPDAMLAVDQYTGPMVELLAAEADAALEVMLVHPAHVLRRQMQQRDAVAAQQVLIVAALVAQVDDGVDAMLACEAFGPVRRKAATDSQRFGDPVEVWLPAHWGPAAGAAR